MKKIKDVIRITGLSRRTLQYYDDLGLVKPKRTKENYRLYGKDELWKLWRLLIYKEMGFQLDEIACLIEKPEEDTHWMLEERLMHIQKEMENLSRMYRFAEKILEYGIPDENFVKQISKTTDYKTMVKCLAERV